MNASGWCYEQAFSRNLGLINPDEQQRLRASRVAIAGMGGVGGIHLMTLARLGIGGFHVADPDTFEVGNFNRQYGAMISTLGRNKAEVLGEMARQINPELHLDVIPEAVDANNVDRFFRDVDLFVDGIDYFSFDSRRFLYAEARRRGIWTVTAGPIGFSTAWLVFDPKGMSFDEYFDLHDGMSGLEKFVAFTVGLAPRATHIGYLDLAYVDRETARGPSASLACRLASGVLSCEVVKILLDRGNVRAAPHYHQFDAYKYVLRHGRLRWGNRGPLQRLKRKILRKKMIELGFAEA
jgi:molybdopterin/thiamine biosynthesis adenylyltransferase